MPDPTPDLGPGEQPSIAPPAPAEPVVKRKVWLTLLTIALVSTVTLMQRPWWSDDAAPKPTIDGSAVTDGAAPQLVLMGKLALGMRRLVEGLSSMDDRSKDPQVLQVAAQFQDSIDASVGWKPESGPVSFMQTAQTEAPASERLQAAVLAGELLGYEALADRLERVEAQLTPDSVLQEDIRTARALYAPPPAPEPEAAGSESPATPEDATPEAKQAFEKRHGWVARLALSHADPGSDFRQRAARQGLWLLAILGTLLGVFGLGFVLGLVLLVLALVQRLSGKLRGAFTRPRLANEWRAAGGGTVWLETVAVFFSAFLLMKLAGAAVAWRYAPGSPPRGVHLALIGAQWLLLPTIFWPVLRGMSWQRWRGEIGWHAGRGVGREIGAGLVAYVAAIPIFVSVVIFVVTLAVVIEKLTGQNPLREVNNSKLNDLIGSGDPALLLLFATLATVWAPVVEESVFRGAFYRHLRRDLPFGLAALGTAIVFALAHGYLLIQLFVILALGLVFAAMREWRSSLIPSVTAHALHNSLVTVILIAMSSLLGD